MYRVVRTEDKAGRGDAAAGLVLTPAFATGTQKKKHPSPITFSFDPALVLHPGHADPKLAAALAGKTLALTNFKFTPPSQGSSFASPRCNSCPHLGAGTEPARASVISDDGGELAHADRL